MFIQTEAMPDPHRMKFFPGEAVLTAGSAEFPNPEAAAKSPLATKLFGVAGVSGVMLYEEFITVAKEGPFDWQILKPMILGAIMDHYATGQPVIVEIGVGEADGEVNFEDRQEDQEIIDQIKEIMESRVRPAAEQMGGDVLYKGFKDGVFYAEFVGPTLALAGGMNQVISHYVPEVTAVKDYRDAIPKPGLDTTEAQAILQVLDKRINPSIAGHGGHISLIDVKEDTAFVRLEGGCQGCGMADVTLKQGVEGEIKSVAPSILHVLDVTDHAGGTNPYYSPGKGGAPA